jgi:hypothetical protein
MAKKATASIGKFTPSLVCYLTKQLWYREILFIVLQAQEAPPKREKKRRVSSFSLLELGKIRK